jgi:hypothetical protein
VIKAIEAAGPERREALGTELVALVEKFNVSGDGTLVLRRDYLEVVIRTET